MAYAALYKRYLICLSIYNIYYLCFNYSGRIHRKTKGAKQKINIQSISNVFNDGEHFIPVFKEHIKLCVEKSVFFGLRNYGSINSVKKYLPDYLRDKLKYQPCPTTIIEAGANKITFFGHHILDKHSRYAKFFENSGYPILPLYKYPENDIYKFYKAKKLVIGMRGHSLMIPFGLTVPVISLETQEKQK